MSLRNKQIKFALLLSIITVFYNIIEGALCIFFGLEHETLVLFGFGLDSFVEVISGVGIWHMVLRIMKNENENKDNFERTALKVTAAAFYLLAIGLFFTAIINLINDSKPETTYLGVIVSCVSISIMWWLIYNKKKIGEELNSDAIIADAKCSLVCIQLSFILLISSLIYELYSINSIDAIGSLLIAYFAYREGVEAFKKSQSDYNCC